MPIINVTDRDGNTKVIDGRAGLSVMEVIRDDGFGNLLAICGGCVSCATCHVYVDPAFAGALPPMKSDEAELLEFTDGATPLSRLSCQISLTDDLAELTVTLAPEA